MSGWPLSLQNSGVGWNGMEKVITRSKSWMWGPSLLQDLAGARGTPGPPPDPIGSEGFLESAGPWSWEGV